MKVGIALRNFFLTGSLAFIVLALGFAACPSARAVEDSTVLAYYWHKTAGTYRHRLEHQAARRYLLRARTYFHKVDKRGKITQTDSLLADYFFTGSRLDSHLVVVASREKHPDVNFSIPSVLDETYRISGFPNDTGGTALAIGFESAAADDPRPDGLLIIDRDRDLPMWLYAYYPRPGRGKRLSRCFRFADRSGIIYPDSLWKVAAEPGLLTRKYYRIETGVLSIELIDGPRK